MFNKRNYKKNGYMLNGRYKTNGYDWWWHSFTGIDEVTKEEKPFFIEYFIVNPGLSKDKTQFGGLGEKPSYLMVKCGTWGKNKKQLHAFYPLKDVSIKKAPYEININDDIYASDAFIKGEVLVDDSKEHPEYMSDDGMMKWELHVDKKIAFNVGYGTSSIFRNLKTFQMFWHAEGMKTEYDGYVILDGKKYLVKKESCYGYADKNWGSGFTSPWVWLSSNHIIDKNTNKELKNTVFDIGGGKPKILFVSLERKLLSALYIEGKEYEFNFSKFLHPVKTKFNCYETEDKMIWHVEQTCRKYKMVTDISCLLDDMLLIRYEDPNGKREHNRLWNGGNGSGTVKLYYKEELIEDLECYNVGCEYGEFNHPERYEKIC